MKKAIITITKHGSSLVEIELEKGQLSNKTIIGAVARLSKTLSGQADVEADYKVKNLTK